MLPILCLWTSCSNYTDINGHWHLRGMDRKNANYIVIDIVDDTTALLSQHSIYGSVLGEHHLEENELNFPGECGAFFFTYKMNGDKLFLENHLENWEGIRCGFAANCCSKVDDFKKDLKLEINFPRINSNSADFRMDKFDAFQEFNSIVIGIPKKELRTEPVSRPVLELDRRISAIEDLELWIASKEIRVPEQRRTRMIYRIIADKNITARELKQIESVLKNKNIKHYYLTVLDDRKQNSNPFFEYIHLGQLDLEGEDGIETLILHKK